MDEPGTADVGHALQRPHLELRAQGRGGFMPLKFEVQPGNVRVEMSRTSAILGRHSRADIRLAFPEVSRRHCRVTFENGQWHIADLDSLNGVFVNGERMHEAVLYDGDRVRIGACVMTVVQGTPVHVVTAPRRSNAQIEMLKNIAEVLPRQAG